MYILCEPLRKLELSTSRVPPLIRPWALTGLNDTVCLQTIESQKVGKPRILRFNDTVEVNKNYVSIYYLCIIFIDLTKASKMHLT
jgi:hypothetical protein